MEGDIKQSNRERAAYDGPHPLLSNVVTTATEADIWVKHPWHVWTSLTVLTASTGMPTFISGHTF